MTDEARDLARGVAKNLRARALYLGAQQHARGKKPGKGEDPRDGPRDEWGALRGEAMSCQKCQLCKGRISVVFGEGDSKAELMFVGEAPGRDEDQQGRPFVGRAGQLLTDMITGMGLRREEVYIANVIKCRPPENRDPSPDEAAACRPYLVRQIELVNPKVLCALGRHSLRALLGDDQASITKLRGRPLQALGRTLVATWHPAYLLRNPPAKRDTWEDLKAILQILGKPVPAARKGSSMTPP